MNPFQEVHDAPDREISNPAFSRHWPVRVALFLFASTVFLAIGYRSFLAESKKVRMERYRELESIGNLKVGRFVQWTNERRIDADALARRTGVRTSVEAWPRTHEGGSIRSALSKILIQERDWRDYDEILILDPEGGCLISTDPAPIFVGRETLLAVRESFDTSESVTTAPFLDPSGKIYLDTVAPVFDESGVPQAAVALRSDPELQLFPLIQSWPVPSESAEVQLVEASGDEVRLLNRLRHGSGDPLSLRFPSSNKSRVASRAAQGERGIIEDQDYRGIEVVSVALSIPDSPWVLIAKLDADEAWAETRYRRKVGMVLGGLGLMLVAAAISLGFRHRESRLYHKLYWTERLKNRAESLHAQLSQVVEHTGDVVFITDRKRVIEYVNPAFEAITGYAGDEAVGQTPLLLKSGLMTEEHYLEMWESVRHGEVFRGEVVCRKRNGEEFYYDQTISPLFNPHGEITHFISAGKDVTERHRAEEVLRESESNLSRAQQIARLGSWTVDPASGEQYWSPEMCRIYGTPIGEPLEYGAFLKRIVPEDRALVDASWKGALKGGDYDVEFRIQVGEVTRWVHSQAFLELDAVGTPRRILGTAQDITERKEEEEKHAGLEAQFRQAHKMEGVGQLAGGVAHDFNNMLTVILGFAEISLQDIEPGSELQANLQEILDAGTRASELTRQLLAFARKQTIAPRILNLNESLAGMLKMLQRLIGEDIDLRWKPAEQLWPVKMDPAQVDQMLVNLVVNARDAISGGGKITIETSRAAFDEAYCADHVGFIPGQYAMLAVSDDGCGIEKANLQKIFEPFFTTKPAGEGTGLGLATVYGIVKQNEGFINAYSELGKGTTFKIYLPHREETEPGMTTIESSVSTPTGTETLLIVEDEEAVLKLATRFSEELGYRVLTASSPAEAFEIADRFKERLHLLLTDVILPGKTGREVWETLSEARPGLKCLFMSGYTANVIAHRGVLYEGVQFLPKPFSRQDFALKIRVTLDQG